ncbi:putative carboxylesterase 18 [Carex littledalei]|uniref:Putative carboxylesterase 18 n=1 Tax=Carex littledalei TaxID=544730 RepID=A0A833V2Z1_9POAL|nr:putative carboxylesterase 18 [Carex littledalei]
MPWKLRLIFKIGSALTDASRRSNGTINRRLLSFFSPHASASLHPSTGVRTSDITIDPSHNLRIRVFVPASPPSTPLPVVVFFHGGGFAYLSAMSHVYDAVCRRFSRKIGAVVVSVDYRLSPEHRYPAPYDDGLEVLRYLDSGGIQSEKVMEGIKMDSSSCFLMGDSAGANIAHHVARRYCTETANWNRIQLAGVIAIQPFFGGEERTESEIRLEGAPLVSQERTDWLWKAFLPEGADKNHEAAYVFSPATELGNAFPPVLLVIGGYDPLQDWQKRYYEMLKQKGKEVQLIEYPNAVHAFYVFPFDESKQLIHEIMAFVEEKRSKAT